MENQNNRRRWSRKELLPPEVGVLYTYEGDDQTPASARMPLGSLFVDLLDKAQGGVLLKASQKIQPQAPISINIYNPNTASWELRPAQAKWISADSTKAGFYRMGVEFGQEKPKIKLPEMAAGQTKKGPLPSDYEFFRSVDLLKLLDRDAVCPILNRVFHKRLKKGERLMAQGDAGDSFYVIQHGTCAIHVEKDGELHRVDRRKQGDIIGEMAILTGEPRSAHVDAESDMELWGLTRTQFDEISNAYPELRRFLTELMADRFSSTKLTAERKIGKYLISDIIGRGGYSIVYKGVHTHLNMPVAIKMLNHDMAMDPDFLERFRKEAQIIALFNHKNIMRVYDIEELYRTIFIITEFMEGESLDDILKRMGAIPPRRALDFLLQICEGLQYAHQQHIIHQDIKPNNIFVQAGDQIKILDFGLAIPVGSEDLFFESTLFYSSPEQIEGELLDQRTDIYALGITAYEMVAGHRPYAEDDLLKLRKMHLDKDIPDPAKAAPDLPQALRDFIITSCQRDPHKRYQNIGEALENLRALAKALGPRGKAMPEETRRMATLFMIYRDEHQLALNKLMEEFSTKVRDLGVVLQAADFKVTDV
jgi:CRP-like cAMP-binding protein